MLKGFKRGESVGKELAMVEFVVSLEAWKETDTSADGQLQDRCL